MPPRDPEPKGKSKGYQPGTGLDYLGIGVELVKYFEKDQKPDWNDIARKAGSASAVSIRSHWNKFCKGYEIVPMKNHKYGGRKAAYDPLLGPVSPEKVEKGTPKNKGPGRPRKVTSSPQVHESDDELPPAKKIKKEAAAKIMKNSGDLEADDVTVKAEEVEYVGDDDSMTVNEDGFIVPS